MHTDQFFLIADIGGSNARFALQLSSMKTWVHLEVLPVRDYASPYAAIFTYLERIEKKLGHRIKLQAAVIAVAAPVQGQCKDQYAKLTNSTWEISTVVLTQQLQLKNCLLLNDFAALALSLPWLKQSQIQSSYPFIPAHGTVAVLGPGTGLGVAALHQCGQHWYAIEGEGGHTTLTANDDYESALLKLARHHHTHISAENFLSGTGIPLLHQCISELEKTAYIPLTCEEIITLGLQDNDFICKKTLEIFCAMLGSFAGDIALIYGARSGIYIGGGIVPRLGDFFFKSRFRQQFESKGKFSHYLETIPTYVIQDGMAALLGCAYALERSDESLN